MTSSQLQQIFQNPFNRGDWREVLQSVFGARQLFETPRPILLPSNDLAKNAFELGSLTTSDDRIIGLYQIDLDENVWLRRNKVSLRQLLRNVYKYDVDGAIVVFVQDEKWRLSFISEIKVLNDEGEVIEQATEPKRFTYLLGKGEKVRTPANRLSKLSGKTLALNDILDAFSVEALNEEFYKIIQGFFYELVGGKVGKGRKQIDYGQGILSLPKDRDVSHQIKQEFAVRLIGRTIFCWFLKMKKSDEGESLIPESLLSTQALKNNSNYYHTLLERLFFQSLNTPMEERRKDLPNGTEHIPFLNGGLFEASKHDYFLVHKKNGISQYANTPFIEDDWFLHLFTELEKYNFTIDENSVTEVEVSVDPEMLGRIFENLLAEIDPDSGESARKATGSFYTPREIVDYMATESLVQYIHNKTEIDSDKIRPVFKMLEQADLEFTEVQIDAVLDALDEVKILDPACGSGAFPMGVLQKIVQALQKLDPDAKKWKKRQIARISNPIVKKQLREKLADSGVEYARKIGIIQNSLYGVDIQPVAAEISKLRCFLSLIVDENIDDQKSNRGVEPLPNLEFKFVTADTLIKLPEEQQRGLFDSFEELQKLADLRDEYIQSYGKKKQKLKDKFLKVQLKIAKDQNNLFADRESKAYKIGNWNPFGHEKSDWFDPKWMFGVEKFDVIIGNPPYIKEYTNKAAFNGIRGEKYYQGKMDIWYYFACYLFDLLSNDGNLTFIATNNWVTNSGASKLREKIRTDCRIKELIDFGDVKVFSSAGIQTMILIAENDKDKRLINYNFNYKKIVSNSATLEDGLNILKDIPNENYIITTPTFDRKSLKGKSFIFNASAKEKFLDRIKEKQNFTLNSKKEVAQGIVAPQDFLNASGEKKLNYTIPKGTGVFVISEAERKKINPNKLETQLLKPYYTTKELTKFYGNKNNKNWIIYTTSDFKNHSKMNDYPNIKAHLDKFKDIITSSNKPYGLHRSRNESFFIGEKIISLRKSSTPTFTYTNFDCYVSQTFFVIKTERINQKYLTALLNSKLIEFWLRYKGKMQGFNFQIDKTPLLEIPIFKPLKTKVFEKIFDYLLLILSNKAKIVNQVPNKHIANLFQEIIDAMILELYFKEDFEQEGVAIIKYAERDFESIEGKSEEEQIEIIQTAYQKLREKDNEIRNNIKLMDIKLADIVMPIKAGKQ